MKDNHQNNPAGNHGNLVLVPDDGTGRAFDTMLRAPGMLQDVGDLHVIEKASATLGGKPGLMLTFTAVLPNGQPVPVQTVVTLKNFLTVAEILRRKHPKL